MAKKKAARVRQVPPVVETAPAPMKDWAVLFYICADIPIDADQAANGRSELEPVEKQLETLAEKLNKFVIDRCHVFLQIDTTNSGATRWELVRGQDDIQFMRMDRRPDDSIPWRIDTGDASEATGFLNWALDIAPARQVAVVFSGFGISRDHVQLLTSGTQSAAGDALERQIHQENLFSICHDASHHNALEAQELSLIFETISRRLGRPVDVLVLDAGLTAFIELAYQLRGGVQSLVAAQSILPDKGWPWRTVETVLQTLAKEQSGSGRVDAAAQAGRRLAEALSIGYRRAASRADRALLAQRPMTAIDLRAIGRAVQHLDYLTSTLLQNLGDWHVLAALLRVWDWKADLVAAGQRESIKKGTTPVERANLFELLLLAEASLTSQIASAPADMGQRDRLRHVVCVMQAVRHAVIPPWWGCHFARHLETLLRVDQSDRDSLHELQTWLSGLLPLDQAESFTAGEDEWYWSDRPENAITTVTTDHVESDDASVLLLARPQLDDVGDSVPTSLMILAPPKLTFNQDPPENPLQHPTYVGLDFSRDASWSLLISAIQLITWKPHALWRLVASMLFSRSGSSRDVILSRLLSEQSVLSSMTEQFRAFRSDQALRLQVRIEDNCDCGEPGSANMKPLDADCETELCYGTGDRETFRLQLEPPSGNAVISENLSPVYRSTFREAVKSFERIINSDQPVDDAVVILRRLGCALGEDVIQDLRDHLDTQRSDLARHTTDAPHLRLQLSTELMAYPWELVSDGHGMLFERFAMGRQFFMPPMRHFPRRSGGPLRVLVLGDPRFTDRFHQQFGAGVQQLSGAEQEAHAVVELFRDLREELRGIVDVWIESHIGEELSVSHVRELLRSGCYDILHYAGHACFNTNDPEGSGWLLSDGLLHAREIRNTLEWARSPPWLVYANACEAGMERPQHAGRGRWQSDVFGLGSAFTAHGVSGYLAPLWPINDDVAVLMATEFYSRLLLERESLGEALFHARQTAKTLLIGPHGESQGSRMPARTALSWAGLVLYGDPAQRLFDSLWGGAASASHGEAYDVNGPGPDDSAGWSSSRFPQSPSAGGGSFEVKSVPSRPVRPRLSQSSTMPRLRQAPTRQLLDMISSPSTVPLDSTRSLNAVSSEFGKVLELVEIDGVRLWRVSDPTTGKSEPLVDSGLEALVSHPAIRERFGVNRSLTRSGERGLKEYGITLGRWALRTFTFQNEKSAMHEFARAFDQATVEKPGLLEYRPETGLARINPNTWKPLAEDERILLVIHGTFSKTESPINGFGQEFWQTIAPADSGQSENSKARHRYRILGYSHWTLAQSPEENANELCGALQELTVKDSGPLLSALLAEAGRAEANGNPPVDIIVHSRGGLVARAFVELTTVSVPGKPRPLPVSSIVRNVFFLGTPNAGTQLAHPKNWGRMANYLVNMVHHDRFGLLGRLSGFLAEAYVRWRMPEIPGLYAQNPETLRTSGSLLNRLHFGATSLFDAQSQTFRSGPSSRPQYLCVAANFEPGPFNTGFDVSSLPKFLSSATDASLQVAGKATGAVIDTALDPFFSAENDLVVDTRSIWSLRGGLAKDNSLPQPVLPEQVLLFNPDEDFASPGGIQLWDEAWIHHCNLFSQRETQQFICDWLGVNRSTRRN
ncbi:MAG: CHAT domain-containing protein [Rhodopirellula sp.]|nr:CHAT domain-containing protein [Rhodopirellula sp.]